MKGWALVLVGVPLATLVVLAIAWLVGCAAAQPAIDVTSYENEQFACIQEAGTRAEADKCRAAVQAKYGRIRYWDAAPAANVTFLDAGGQ